jgi:hypothetical protein
MIEIGPVFFFLDLLVAAHIRVDAVGYHQK